jgi:uncharacterized membrane protein YfcA
MKMDYRARLDAIGIGASFACALHCVLLPLLMTTFTLFGVEIIENIYLELSTIVVSMSVGGWAIYKGYKKHHHRLSLVLIFGAGLFLVIVGNLVSSVPVEIICKLIGCSCIILAHIGNWRHRSHYCINTK